jgi:hypothetical protein
MKINVTTRNEDGSVAFTGSLNKAEVTTILQYGINNLIALGYVFGQADDGDEEEAPSRIKGPGHKGLN